MGARNHFTDEQILDALRKSAGVQVVAAKRLEEAFPGRRCSRQLITMRLARSRKLREEFDQLLERNLDIAEAKLFQAINDGESWAVQFLLKTKGKSRGWTEKLDVSGEIVHRRAPDIDIDRASLEELEAFIRERSIEPAG